MMKYITGFNTDSVHGHNLSYIFTLVAKTNNLIDSGLVHPEINSYLGLFVPILIRRDLFVKLTKISVIIAYI